MNQALPASCRDFLNKEYWSRLFRKTKKEADTSDIYDWYGDYNAFGNLLKKHIQKDDQVMISGSGKSVLSEQLYDNQVCCNIVNVDSDVKLLDYMQNRKKRDGITYVKLEQLQQNSQFNVIIDKATLDTLDEGNVGYISNLMSSLKLGGKLIIITLLQEQALEQLLNEAVQWKIEIFETVIEQTKLFPFFIVVTKQEQQQPNKIQLYQLNGGMTEFTIKQIPNKIKTLQLQHHFTAQICKLRQSQSFVVDISSHELKQTPRYTLYIYDSESTKALLTKTCACFIIPQGRESTFIFGTTQGHKELLAQTQMSRLVIARLNPGHTFQNLKQVQSELSPTMTELIFKGCTNQPCPFMTDGDEIGDKVVLFESEDCFVEEVDNEGSKSRRLVLKNSLDLMQCQARVLQNKIDNNYLEFEAHIAMVAGMGFVKGKDVLILGGGVGLLSNFLSQHLGANVTNIEINEDIISVGKLFFNYEDNQNQRMVCCDALEYVEQAQKSYQYSVIIIDINSSEQNTISPPEPFRSAEFLEKLKSMLTPEGVIMMNVLDNKKQLKQLQWDLYFSRKCENDVNEVYYLVQQPGNENKYQIKKETLQQYNEQLQQFKHKIKQLLNNSLNLAEEVDEIKLKYPIIVTQAFQVQQTEIVEEGQVKDQRKDFYQEDLAKVQKKKHNRKRKNKN